MRCRMRAASVLQRPSRQGLWTEYDRTPSFCLQSGAIAQCKK